MPKSLTLQLIQQKVKSDAVHQLKNLNLWGNDLDDLGILEQLPNLEVLSLSVNCISTLKDIAKCPKLQELYLRKNNISDINEILYLQKLKNLKVLWLSDNPIADHPNYKKIVMKYSPHLEKLDNQIITSEDRAQIGNVNLNNSHLYDDEQQQQHQQQSSQPQTQPQTQPQPQQQIIRQNISHQQERSKIQQAEQQQPPREFQIQQPNQYEQYKNQIGRQEIHQQPLVFNISNQYQQQNLDQAENENSGYETNNYERNENILCAILALLKELDENSLEVVRRDVEKRLSIIFALFFIQLDSLKNDKNY